MARKTKAPVQFTVGEPQVGDAMIWNGNEWVRVKIQLWEEVSNKLFQKNAGPVVVGKDTTSYETAVEPRADLRKDIGAHALRFRDMYLNKVVVYGEILFAVGGGETPVIKWIEKLDGENLILKGSDGNTKAAFLQDGDLELFK